MNHLLDEAITAIENGDKETGRQKLQEILVATPSDELILLLLESITENLQEKSDILNQILLAHPNSQTAQKRLFSLNYLPKSNIKSPYWLINLAKHRWHLIWDRYPVITIIFVVLGAISATSILLLYSLMMMGLGIMPNWTIVIFVSLLLGSLVGGVMGGIVSFILRAIIRGVEYLYEQCFQLIYKSRREKL